MPASSLNAWAVGRFPWKEHQRRKRLIKQRGLPCRVFLKCLNNELWSLVCRPRRGWVHLHTPGAFKGCGPYHISICQRRAATPALLSQVRARWHGRVVRFRHKYMGVGAYMELRGAVTKDPAIRALHAAGWYHNRPLHISL
jgi:hypothetical protein